MKPALRRVASRAAVVVVPSEATAGAVLDAGVGIAENRIVIVPEGADHLPEPDHRQPRRCSSAWACRVRTCSR